MHVYDAYVELSAGTHELPLIASGTDMHRSGDWYILA